MITIIITSMVSLNLTVSLCLASTAMWCSSCCCLCSTSFCSALRSFMRMLSDMATWLAMLRRTIASALIARCSFFSTT